MVRGLSNRGIAEVLGLSERTVEHHIAAAAQAYAVRGRSQLAGALLKESSQLGSSRNP
ncbi:MAG: LuxR C-terminal-related transcriptional regulator [Nocardioides sp.]